MEKIVLNLLYKYHGNWDDVYSAISKKEDANNHKLNFMWPEGLKSVFIIDENYPNKFKDIAMPPFFVFWQGNINLLDTYVLTFTSSTLVNDYELLMSKSQLLNKYTLCFNAYDINKSKVVNLINKGYNIILVATGGLNKLQFSEELVTNQLLLVSEFWDANSYKQADCQTIERIMFAIADALYITIDDIGCIERLFYNYERKHKMVFCLENLKNLIVQQNEHNLKISYVKNICDIYK